MNVKNLDNVQESVDDGFDRWLLGTRIHHIRYMMFFTALLYVLYAYFESSMVLNNPNTRLWFHGVIIPLSLGVIYLLTYYPAYYKLMLMLLVLAPVTAVWTNLFLNLGYDSFAHFAPEIYLNIIWTFTMSGLTLRYSFLAVGLSLSAFLSMIYLRDISAPAMSLHFLWAISSTVFGVITAIILEHLHRNLYQQQQTLVHAASTDPLTGLWNRDKLIRQFNRDINKFNKVQRYSVMMLDLDHFKSVNDNFGHIVGDKVLLQCSQLLKHHIGALGHTGRYGGEEFCILLPNAIQKEAEIIANSLLQTINQYSFEVVGHLTISIGLTQYQTNDSFESLISRADQALYLAKQSGRNNVKSL